MSAQLRSQAVEIYQQGLAAVASDRLLGHPLMLENDSWRIAFLDRAESVPFAPAGRMVVLAVGKGAAPMARAAAVILGDRGAEGMVVTKRGFSLPDLPYQVRQFLVDPIQHTRLVLSAPCRLIRLFTLPADHPRLHGRSNAIDN